MARATIKLLVDRSQIDKVLNDLKRTVADVNKSARTASRATSTDGDKQKRALKLVNVEL